MLLGKGTQPRQMEIKIQKLRRPSQGQAQRAAQILEREPEQEYSGNANSCQASSSWMGKLSRHLRQQTKSTSILPRGYKSSI